MRIYRVKSCRKAQGHCGKCRKPIEVGDPYIYIEPRFGPKKVRCTDYPCRFRGSDMTGSEIKQTIYAYTEGFEDSVDNAETMSDVKMMLETVAEGAREVVDLIQEKMDAIEDGIGHTDVPVYEELEERRGEMEAWADEVENAMEEIDDDEDLDFPCRGEEDEARFFEEVFEAAVEAAREAVSNCPE